MGYGITNWVERRTTVPPRKIYYNMKPLARFLQFKYYLFDSENAVSRKYEAYTYNIYIYIYIGWMFFFVILAKRKCSLTSPLCVRCKLSTQKHVL